MKYRATIYKDGQYWTVEICKQKAVIMRHIADTWDNALDWACFQLKCLRAKYSLTRGVGACHNGHVGGPPPESASTERNNNV